MKLRKEKLTNFAVIVFLALLLFTPVGFHARVFMTRLISFSPTVLSKEERLRLTDYSWKLLRLNGEKVDLKDLEGRVVLINFWATWCPPCVAEMPSLDNLFEDYGADVEFVLVAHDDPKRVSAFLARKDYDFPVFFEAGRPPGELRVESIPTTYLIDRNGHVRVKKIGAADWNSTAVRELLSELIKEEKP